MRTLVKIIGLLFLSLGLFACGPVYRTITHYDSPTNETGQHCVMQCENHRNQCKDDCAARFDACTYAAEERGRVDYLDAKERYLNEKERCMMRGYKKPPEGCDNLKEPNLRQFTNDPSCHEECGCDSDFDRCFQVCGGKLRHETHCVSACEKS